MSDVVGNVTFCVPTVYRPEILEATLASFRKHLDFNLHQLPLLLHVDAAPQPLPCSADDVVEVARRFFTDIEVLVQPVNVGYPTAAKWLLSIAKTPWIFYLEDDWVMRRTVSLEDLYAYAASKTADTNIVQVRLSRSGVNNSSLICTSPGLVRRDFYHMVAERMQTDMAFESQFKKLADEVYGTRKIARVFRSEKSDTVVDNGRSWRSDRGLRKPNEMGGLKTSFITWVQT